MNKTQQQNIDNLTSLWETVSQPFQAYFDKEHMAYSIIPDAEWPNRIWSKVELTEYILTQMLDILKVETDLSAISLFMDREDEAYWDPYNMGCHYRLLSNMNQQTDWILSS